MSTSFNEFGGRAECIANERGRNNAAMTSFKNASNAILRQSALLGVDAEWLFESL